MAARLRRIELDQQWRERIRTGVLLDRLQKHVLGTVELSTTQVRAAEILLRKTIPDQSESKSTVMVRRLESLSEEQARMMAEELIEQSRRTGGVCEAQSTGVHGSVST